jgi:hypothetical protein
MLQFKNKEGKVVMTENAETGKIQVLDESLKALKETLPDQAEDSDE